MLINTTWLLDYLEPKCAPRDLLEAFTAAGLEVEQEHNLAEELRGVVIGFIREKTPLAEAPGLFHTRIEISPGRLIDVVCASEHEVQEGWGVPVAVAGTTLPDGTQIRPAKLHGVQSQGMICLDGEMGLVARGSGLQVFEDEALLGKPLPEVAEIDEWLVDLAVLPNRPDCLGMIGIAREMAAVLHLTLNYPVPPERHLALAAQSKVPVHIEDASLCPRYLGQLIRGVRVGPSPHWLKSRLQCAGKRPINNVVDITNFVLLEWGQPLHAFDFSTLQGGEIHVRRMKVGEELELLDGTVICGEEPLPLVIADAQRPVALAGIMGGAATQTTPQTTDVLLEAACFDPVHIRFNAKRLNVRTDSTYRFERGTDPNRMLTGAATRAAELIVELAGGELDGSCTEQYPLQREPRVFTLSTERVSRYLGMPVEAETIRSHLQKLEMQCSEDLRVEVPTWRADCNDPVALIEDVARLIGYNEIPLQPSAAPATPGKTLPLDQLRRQLAEELAAAGFLECRTPPLRPADEEGLFADNDSPACKPIRLQNPMRSDMTELRRSLIPSLLEVVQRNARRGADHFRFFEIDRTFFAREKEPAEIWSLGLVFGGPLVDINWERNKEQANFYHLKGLVENLLEGAGLSECLFEPVQRAGFRPGQAARITITASRKGEEGKGGGNKENTPDRRELGILGEVDAALLADSKLRIPIFAAELSLPALLESFEELRTYVGLPRTPALERDFAVILPVDITYHEIEQTVQAAFAEAARQVQQQFLKTADEKQRATAKGAQLENVQCIDYYRGKPIPPDRKSLAVRLLFRDPGRTLTSEEANEILQSVIEAVVRQHGAELRG